MKSTPFQPLLSVEQSSELIDLRNRLREVYPTASNGLIIAAIEACRLELAGETDDTGRLIRCVCERMTA